MRACFFRSNILFIIKHRSVTFVQLVNYAVRNYPELDPKIIRRIVNMMIKGYSQLIDIVNFCGKQHNISSSKIHMALIYCQWSNDLGFITRSSNKLLFTIRRSDLFSAIPQNTHQVETIFIVSSYDGTLIIPLTVCVLSCHI